MTEAEMKKRLGELGLEAESYFLDEAGLAVARCYPADADLPVYPAQVRVPLRTGKEPKATLLRDARARLVAIFEFVAGKGK